MKEKFKVDLNGELVLNNLSGYKTSLLPLIDEDMEIILDLNKISRIDIAGIQLILCFMDSRIKRGCRVYLDFHENKEIIDLFRMLGIDKII